MSEKLLTSVEAAKLLGLAASTTRNAAAGGKVNGAYPDTTRTGTIQPPWVATEVGWREWAKTVRPRAKRVAAPLLSDQARNLCSAIAARADHLNGRQLRGYSPQRQEEIDRLQAEWRVVRGIADRTEQ